MVLNPLDATKMCNGPDEERPERNKDDDEKISI